MVILDEEQANERSPLKSPTQPLPGPAAAPPPPYAATTSQPQAHIVVERAPVPDHLLVIHRNGPAVRFFKALIVALFILFLWSIFIDTLRLLAWDARGGKKKGPYPYHDKNQNKLEWIVHDWYKGKKHSADPCPCDTVGVPSMPGHRALPIHYPPALPHVQPTPPCSTAAESPLPTLSDLP